MIDFIQSMHDSATTKFFNTEQFLLNPLVDARFISNLIISYEVLLSTVGEGDREAKVKAIAAVIEKSLPINFFTKELDEDPEYFYNLTRPDGFCFYHSLSQLEANWKHYKASNKTEFLSWEQLKNYQLPKMANELIPLFVAEKEKLMQKHHEGLLPPGIVAADVAAPGDKTLIQTINNVIKEISPPNGHLVNPITGCAPKSSGNSYETWGDILHYPYFYVSNDTPFMVFNGCLKDIRYSTSK